VLGGPRRTVLEMARANDAIAAVNGDFPAPDRLRPGRPFARDDELVHSGTLGPVFALARDESTAFFGRPIPVITVTDLDSGRSLRLDRLNFGPPAPGEIAGFSPVGGTLEVPPSHACSVRLMPVGGISFDEDRTGVVSDHVVDAAACQQEPMTRDGGIVLSAPPATDEATQLLAMTPGTPVRFRWSLGWPGVYDAIGGIPILVRDGEIVVRPCSEVRCVRHPATGIGYTAAGEVLLVVVDGRNTNWSIGANIPEFAAIMRDLGAVHALNFDGGGSSTMIVEDEVVNRPSDGQLRHLSNAVLVLRGPDPGEA
jgi:Phosphodiester glycosidase